MRQTLIYMSCMVSLFAQSQDAQITALSLTSQAIREFYSGNYEAAITTLQKANAKSDEVFEVHFWLGRIHASKAASSPETKALAIKHLSRALELQPIGETADITNAWLIKVGGRPRQILLARAIGERATGLFFNVKSLVDRMQTLASKRMFAVSSSEKEVRVDAKPIELEEIQRIGRGWLACVAIDKFDIVNASKGGYYGSAECRVWLFDSVSKHWLPVIKVYAGVSSIVAAIFGGAEYDVAKQNLQEEVSEALFSKVADVCLAIPNERFFDEVMYPTNLDGVYARSGKSYDEALKSKILLMPTLLFDEYVNSEDVGLLNSEIQGSLMDGGLSIVSSSQAEKALAKVSYRMSTDQELLMNVGSLVGAEFALYLRVTLEKVEVEKNGPQKLVKVRKRISAKVIECKDGSVLLDQEFEGYASKQEWLKGDPLDLVQKMKHEARTKMCRLLIRAVFDKSGITAELTKNLLGKWITTSESLAESKRAKITLPDWFEFLSNSNCNRYDGTKKQSVEGRFKVEGNRLMLNTTNGKKIQSESYQFRIVGEQLFLDNREVDGKPRYAPVWVLIRKNGEKTTR